MANRWDERNREVRDDRAYDTRGERDDRSALDRAGDEVRSWFGDDEAARRRRADERYDRDWDQHAAIPPERGWDRAREGTRSVADREGRRGPAEWRDDDRRWAPEPERTYLGRAGDWRRGGPLPRRDDGFARQERVGARRDPAFDADRAPVWTRDDSTYGGDRDVSFRNYTGRGPRGYKRGDDRIREDVCDRLTEESRIDASDVDVQVTDGEVLLSGSVRSRDEKRFAEDLVERVAGVRDVNNTLKVRPHDEVLGTARSGAAVLGLNDTPPPPASKTT